MISLHRVIRLFLVFILLVTDLLLDHADTLLELQSESMLLDLTLVLFVYANGRGTFGIQICVELVDRVQCNWEVFLDVGGSLLLIKFLFASVQDLDEAVPVLESLVALETVREEASS